MTKEIKERKSIYTVAVSPLPCCVLSLERNTASHLQETSTVIQARRPQTKSSTLPVHRGIHPGRLNHARLLGVRRTAARNSAQALPVVPEILPVFPHARRPLIILIAVLIAVLTAFLIALILFPSPSSMLGTHRRNTPRRRNRNTKPRQRPLKPLLHLRQINIVQRAGRIRIIIVTIRKPPIDRAALNIPPIPRSEIEIEQVVAAIVQVVRFASSDPG